jgi:hypothetical protein
MSHTNHFHPYTGVQPRPDSAAATLDKQKRDADQPRLARFCDLVMQEGRANGEVCLDVALPPTLTEQSAESQRSSMRDYLSSLFDDGFTLGAGTPFSIKVTLHGNAASKYMHAADQPLQETPPGRSVA